MRRIKLIIMSALTALLIFGSVQSVAAFSLFGGSCNLNDQTKNSPACQQATNQSSNPIVDTISIASSIIALITGLAAVIMIIISGLTMITSGGNQEAVTASRRRLVAALVGLILIVLAWAIIRFVTDKVIS